MLAAVTSLCYLMFRTAWKWQPWNRSRHQMGQSTSLQSKPQMTPMSSWTSLSTNWLQWPKHIVRYELASFCMFLQLTDSSYNRKNVVRAKAPHFPLHFEARKISRAVSHWSSLHSRPNAPSFSLELHSLWPRARGLRSLAPVLSTVSTSLIIKCQKQWRAGVWRTRRAPLQSERP